MEMETYQTQTLEKVLFGGGTTGKLLDKFEGMASVTVFNGQSCLLWDDLWNDRVRRLQFPQLHSFPKNKNLSVSMASSTKNFLGLFNLPLSVQAYQQFEEFQSELAELITLNSSLNIEPSIFCIHGITFIRATPRASSTCYN